MWTLGELIQDEKVILLIPRVFYLRKEQAYSPGNSRILVQDINSEQVHFPAKSIIQQNIWIYQATVKDKKE